MQAGGLSGRRLAGYELGAFLGEDGFGPTYEARHLNLGRVFALRVLSDQFTFAQGFEEAFGRVAQVLSTLEHANLLTLDDYGIDGPYAYLVMPFVEGVTLDAWLNQRPGRPATPAQVARLFGQMLAGLGHAHRAKVTHLGLTPGHIFVQPNGHVLVANLGLPYLAEQLWITWNGSRSFGDPLYLAPEQMPGRTPSGVAADMYALGVILYRLLTGALPFEGSAQVVLAAKQAGPPPLRARHPDLPASLDVVVQRALAPSPADRWASAAEFGGAFFQALGQANPLPSSTLSGGGADRSVPLLLPPGEESPAGAAGSLRNTPTPGYAPPGGRKGQPSRTSQPSLPPIQPPGGPAASPGEGSKVLSWSSAGRGRISPPPPPSGWGAGAAAGQVAPARSFARRLLSALVRVVIILVTLAVLGFAIYFGFQRWAQIQHQTPTPTPVKPSPTPKHHLGFSNEPTHESLDSPLLYRI
jgi:serine/threonine protein kinase